MFNKNLILNPIQQQITSKLEFSQPEVNPKPIIVQQEVTSKPKVVQETHPKPIFLLPKHLDLEVEKLEVVPISEYDQPIYPQTYVTIQTSPLL